MTQAFSIPPEFEADRHQAQEAEKRYLGGGSGIAAGEITSLNQAVAAWERILSHHAFAQVSESFRLVVLNNSGGTFLRRYWEQGQIRDLERALTNLQQALELTPPDSPDRPGQLNNLGSGLRTRYTRTGDLADLDWAIGVFEQAVTLTPPDSPDRFLYLNNLGAGLNERYRRTGDMTDLERAIAMFKQAVALTPQDSSELPGNLSNLGVGLHARYVRTGQMADLEQALRVYQQAVAKTPLGFPERYGYLTNLGNGLSARYARTGQMTDLEEMLRVYQQAVKETPPDSPELPLNLSNLGTGLSDRYARTGQMADLKRAVRVYEQALALTPPDSPERTMYLNNLGNGLRARYTRTGDMADLDRAIGVYEQAVALTPPDSPELPRNLNNLGTGLRARYARTGDMADLERAIGVYEQALALTPPDSPERTMYLNNLGNGLRARYTRTGQMADLEEAIRSYQRACKQGSIVALEEGLRSSRNWGSWALQRQTWQEAVEAYRYGLDAIDQLFKTQFLRASKESWLGEAQGLPAGAAYALARCGRLSEAVEVLENGRARLFAENLRRAQVELGQLERTHPQLVRRYRMASDKINALQNHELQKTLSPEQITQEMRAAQAELEEVISDIQQVKGYETFIKALTFGEIQAASHILPLVYTAVTQAGGLALVVMPSGEPIPLWLDGLDDKTLRERLQGPDEVKELGGYLGAYIQWRTDSHNGNFRQAWFDTLEATTRWLWQVLMAPLTQKLVDLIGFKNLSGLKPEIALIPQGLLSLLPLHAAWTEDASRPTGRRYAHDEINFSYAPNAQALLAAQKKADIKVETILAVDNPDGSLSFSADEVEAVLSHFQDGHVERLEGKKAILADVREKIPHAQVLHFSTHGSAGFDQPLEGGLLMANDKHLTLGDVLTLHLENVRLAVLSACETGIPGTKLPDEFISLPAGLMQAGVAGVASTLWAVNDASTMFLMTRFYEGWRGKGLKPSEALRQAQIWLRDTTNAEWGVYLEPHLDKLRSEKMSEQAAHYALRNVLMQDTGGRIFAHPFYWAAFGYTGV